MHRMNFSYRIHSRTSYRWMEEVNMGVAASMAETPPWLRQGQHLILLHNESQIAYQAILESLESAMDRVRQDKRAGSKVGRPKRLARLPCAWKTQYLGCPPSPPIYGPSQFQDTFGIPMCVFENVLELCGTSLSSGSAADGRPAHPADTILLLTLRILRTGSPAIQFDDQCGMGRSTISEKFR
jgi:hypothetical protein